MAYDAFISYSHAGDGKLAPALRSALQRFAKPWYRRRALRLFRDQTSLAATPELWPTIQTAIDDASHFLLLASPEAAASKWVRREVAHWLATKPPGRLFSGADAGTIELWDPESGAAVGPALTGHEGEVLALVFSSDGSILVSGARVSSATDKAMRFWDVARGEGGREQGESLLMGVGGVARVAFNPDDSILATAGEDGAIRLWDTKTRLPIGQAMIGHEGYVSDVLLGPDGTLIYSAGGDGTIRQWQEATRQPIGEPIVAGQGVIARLVMNRNGTLLATGGDDGALRLWHVATGRGVFDERSGASTTPTAMAYSPDGVTIATGHAGGEVLLWNAADGALTAADNAGIVFHQPLCFHPVSGPSLPSSWEGGREVRAYVRDPVR